MAWAPRALGAALLLAALPAAAQVVPVEGDLLVTSLGSGLVYRLDPTAPAPVAPEVVATGPAFTSPRGLAVDRNGFLLVVDNGPKTLSRIDPSRTLRLLAAQFSAVQSALREVAAASDGRVFVADPGIVPLVDPPLPAVRGITYFPLVSLVDVIDGVTSGGPVGGCELRESGKATCGNLFLPTGVDIEREDPEVVLLVADAGEFAPDGITRVHQGVIRVFPDRLFDPPVIADPNNPPYPATGDGVNDELFCAPGPFATPRSLVVDHSPGHEGSVLVTDWGAAAPAARVFRVAPEGCNDPGDPPVELVAQGGGLQRPFGIVVADDGTIFVADALADRVFRIDPDTDPLDPDGNGTGTLSAFSTATIDQASDLQIQRAAPLLYFVAETSPASVLRVDPALPARTTLSTGGSLLAPATLEVLPASAGLLVADPTAAAVIEVGLGGSQTVVSQGGRLVAPTSASREATGSYLVTDLGDAAAVPPVPPAVIRVDPTHPSPGNQTLVSEGGLLLHPVAGAVDGDAFLIVADAGNASAQPDPIPPRIVRISPTAGLPSSQGQAVLFSGAQLLSPAALTLDEGGGVILVVDRGDATKSPPVAPSVLRLARQALSPGQAAVVAVFAGNAGAGNPNLLETPAGIALDGDRSILVTDAGDASTADDAAVIRIDPLSGLESLVAIGAASDLLDLPTGIGVVAPAPGALPDRDGDGIADADDNCIAVANQNQRDTDDPIDKIGNACDPDYDDNGAVGTTDFAALRRAFGSTLGSPRYDPDIDADGDGAIGSVEFALMRSCFGTLPGVSGLVAFVPGASYCRP